MTRHPTAGTWHRLSPFVAFRFARDAIGGVRSTHRLLDAFLNPVSVVVWLVAATLTDPRLAGALLAASAILALAWGVLRWARFRYRVGEERLQLLTGVLERTAVDIPYERIQSVSVRESLVGRVLGLVTVGVDTAGSSATEGSLPLVGEDVALLLRQSVAAARREEKGEARHPIVDAAAERCETPPLSAPDEGNEEVRAQLSHPSGARVLAVSSEELLRLGVARTPEAFLLALGGLLLATIWLSSESGEVEGVRETIAYSLSFFGVAAAPWVALGLVLAAISIAAALIRFHDFGLWDDGKRLATRAGLLARRETSVGKAKIQMIELREGVLGRCLKRCELLAHPAGHYRSADSGNAGARRVGRRFEFTVKIPVLTVVAANEMQTLIWADETNGVTLEPRSPAFRRISPSFILATTLRGLVLLPWVGTFATGLISMAIAAYSAEYADFHEVYYAHWPVILWWTLALVPVLALLSWQRWRRTAYMASGDAVAVRSGTLGYAVELFLMRKVQVVRVRQSPLQRRRSLATLEVQLANDALRLPYIDWDEACRLRDLILHRVEASAEPWH